jgi:hypothetical protein
MRQLSVVITMMIVMALSGGAIAKAPEHEAGSLPSTMLASDGMVPAEAHAGGHEAIAAYQMAIDYPDVLASVPCLCGCIQALGHTNNLDCYIESSTRGVTIYTSHGVLCLICQRITEDAVAGAAQGMDSAQLYAMIIEKYGG